MVEWLAPSSHSRKSPGLNPSWDPSVWSLHVLPVLAWVSSKHTSFLPQSKDMHVIDSVLTVNVKYMV